LHWLIVLEESQNDADVFARLQAWLMQSMVNVEAWDEACHLSHLIGLAGTEAQQTSPVLQPQKESWRGPPKFASRSKWLVPALAAALCGILVFQADFFTRLSADYMTGTAEMRDVRLADGSIVHLGADSAIKVDFTKDTRRVTLLSGEAYFEVTPAEKPFKVAALDVETTVVGTAFDVNLSSAAVAVAVNHGRVKVAARDTADLADNALQAGDWVRVGRNGAVEHGNGPPDLAGGWRNGMLAVQDQRVVDVIDEIRRRYHGTIFLADRQIGELRVTGVYDLKAPVEALRAVVEAHGAHIRQLSPWLTIVSR